LAIEAGPAPVIREYETIREIRGPLLIVEGISDAAYDEIVEVELSGSDFDFEGFIEDSRDFLPEGLRFKGFRIIGGRESLIDEVRSVSYRIVPGVPFDYGRVEELKASERLISRKGKEVKVSEFVEDAFPDGKAIVVNLAVRNGITLNVQDILFWLGLDLESADVIREKLIGR